MHGVKKVEHLLMIIFAFIWLSRYNDKDFKDMEKSIMALDGITVSCLKKELQDLLLGGYIMKIAQPEKDELLMTIKNNGTQYRLSASANPSLPLLYITDKNKQSPITAPGFCMLLRKHIGSGHITSIEQPSLERVIIFTIEHRNELGDPCKKKLIIELMGKHSNIIFTDENDVILDSIRRISANVSSVREVLPGRHYFIPQTQEKYDPLSITEDNFINIVFSKSLSISKALYTSFIGFSPLTGEEICQRAGVTSELFAPECTSTVKEHIFHTFSRLTDEIKLCSYKPSIYYEDGRPIDFSVLESSVYASNPSKNFSSVSELLNIYYSQRNTATRIKQKSADLRKLVSTFLERNVKKLQIQQKQLKDTEKKDKFRIYGELLNTYGYEANEGDKALKAINYYTGESITIPLDPTMSATDNAKKYFEKYNKLKRTFEAVSIQLQETADDIEHLESIQNALDIAADEADLMQINDELHLCGYIKKRSAKKQSRQHKAKPMHFISSDGLDIYVGKNNYQNDELTFSSPMNHDWWFHSKGIPGSHVVVKSKQNELPDSTYEEAARLAAYFSKGRTGSKVEIDYTLRKNIKKPNKSKPGFVIYYTNYSMMASPDISGIKKID